MKNSFEAIPTPKPKSKKEKLTSGLGKETGLPSQRKTYIPYDSFVGDRDDLKLEPKADNLSGKLKELIRGGKYVPRKLLQGEMSDEQLSNLYKSKEALEEELDNAIDNPLSDEEEEINGPRDGEAYSEDEEARKLQKIDEQKDWDYDSPEEEETPKTLEEVEAGSDLDDHNLPPAVSIGRDVIDKKDKKFRYRDDEYKDLHGESHVKDKVTAAQLGHKQNEELGEKVQEYMHKEYNKEVAAEKERHEDELSAHISLTRL